MLGSASPMDWALRQFGNCEFGDVRRTNRFVLLAASAVKNSSESLPAQTGSAGAAKAAYRFLAEPDVTHKAICTPHWEDVRHRARTPGLGAVLFIQDGTELDYTHHPETTGLGFIGDGRGRGIELQTTLCVLPGTPEPEVLGMAFSHIWVRDYEPRGKKETLAMRNARHKESDVWADSLEAIGSPPKRSSGTRWVSVSDRGSDGFSFLARAAAQGWSCLVRSKHNRRLENSDETSRYLHDFARSMPSVDTFTIDLRTRPKKPARRVLLNLAFAPVTLPPPSGTKGKSISAWCIRFGKTRLSNPWNGFLSPPTQSSASRMLWRKWSGTGIDGLSRSITSVSKPDAIWKNGKCLPSKASRHYWDYWVSLPSFCSN